MAKKWIQSAIKRPGALKAKAKRKGLLKEGETLSESDLSTLAKSGDTRTKRQVALARTLKGMNKGKGRKKGKSLSQAAVAVERP